MTVTERACRDQTERERLVERSGGMTAHTQAPAKGLWKDKSGTEKDDLVIFEVMVKRLDRPWWKSYRRQLEKKFKQKESWCELTRLEHSEAPIEVLLRHRYPLGWSDT
jgi:hypothetical protein